MGFLDFLFGKKEEKPVYEGGFRKGYYYNLKLKTGERMNDAKFIGKKGQDLIFNDDGEDMEIEEDTIVKVERVK
jgi:hypothetical protein